MFPTIGRQRLRQIGPLLHQRHHHLLHVHQQHHCHLNAMESSLLSRMERMQIMQLNSSRQSNMYHHFAAMMELAVLFISLYLRLLQGGMMPINHLLKDTISGATGNNLSLDFYIYFLLVDLEVITFINTLYMGTSRIVHSIHHSTTSKCIIRRHHAL